MIDSKGSVVVGGQGSHDRLSGTPVVPDRGGQGEHALQDPHGNTRHGASAMLFEVELAFEGLIDRFDALPYRTQQATTRPFRFTAIRWPHHSDTPVVKPVLGIAVAVTLVHHQDQPIRVMKHVRDRKSTRLNSSHTVISYAVFCLKKKTKYKKRRTINRSRLQTTLHGGRLLLDRHVVAT